MELRESRRLDPDGFLRKTFTLPVEDARAKAREILREFPAGGYMTIVEDWRHATRRTNSIHDASAADGGSKSEGCWTAQSQSKDLQSSRPGSGTQ